MCFVLFKGVYHMALSHPAAITVSNKEGYNADYFCVCRRRPSGRGAPVLTVDSDLTLSLPCVPVLVVSFLEILKPANHGVG